MKKQSLDNVVFVGEVDAGKSALVDKLVNMETNTGKTQSPIFYPGKVIDTPGEFIDKRSLNGALLTTICNVKNIVLLQPANGKRFAPPNGLLNVYPNKNIIGVISKVDESDADIIHARKLFKENRIPEPYFEVSIFDQDSIDKLSHYLLSL
ncbi:EutP/PduV family microcompartment system protein [Photobacterium nomapromontoriensis]|uniref:EutP/PduV family microcompartment system protein n=1 Tax=Photobacterium nomapromontoriensis TaxID=2910237 RepID=UPI003D0FD2AE